MKLKSYKQVLAALVTIAALVLPGLVKKAAAATIYEYTGNFFTSITNNTPPVGAYTTADRVTGSFSLPSALAANLPATFIIPDTFSFNDGRSTLTNFTPGLGPPEFLLSTDSSADILTWIIQLTRPFPSDVPGAQEFRITTSNIGLGQDQGGILERVSSPFGLVNSSDGASTISQGPGSWTSSPTSAPIPEPATMLLLGSGLAGLGFFRKRRKDRKNPSIA